jgi:hypothetical protein
VRQYFSQLSLALFDEAHHICTTRFIDLLEDLQETRRFFFTATPKETKALSMFGEPEDESSDEPSPDSRDDLLVDSSDESVAERSRRLIGGLIFEYGFANAMARAVARRTSVSAFPHTLYHTIRSRRPCLFLMFTTCRQPVG